MAGENETMAEAIIEGLKERFRLVGSHLKALRKDIDNARRDLKQRSSENNSTSLVPSQGEIEELLPIAERLISSKNILEHVMEV